jgi:hypothetical protein
VARQEPYVDVNASVTAEQRAGNGARREVSLRACKRLSEFGRSI